VHGSDLNTATSSSSFTPSSSSDWKTINVDNINSEYYVSNFRFKIEFESDGGNNIFIDDINLYPASSIGIMENSNLDGFSLYPNPVSNQMEVKFSLNSDTECSVNILNSLGEVVDIVYNGQLLSGQNVLGYNATNLSQGVYYLQLNCNGVITTHKFVKNY